MALVSVRT